MNLEFFNESVEFAKNHLKKDGEFYPMFVANTVTNERFVIVAPWESDKQKQLTVAYVRLLFISEYVTEYVFMTEMWFKRVASMADQPKGSLADLPSDQREEGLACVYGKHSLNKIDKTGVIFKVTRNPLIQLEKLQGVEVNGGEFLDMLSTKGISTSEREHLKDVLDTLSKLLPFSVKKKRFH